MGASTEQALAGVAQLVEQLIRNQQVVRSIRIAGSIFTHKPNTFRLSSALTTRRESQSESQSLLTGGSASRFMNHCYDR